MRLRRLGRTELMVSELGFGAFAIGGNRTGNSYGPTDDRTSIAAVHTALELGCNFFDTADVYGHGHSETLLGRALREAGKLHDVVIATKVGGRFDSGQTVIDFSPAYIVRAVDDSLRRLGREHIDLYQLHNPSRAQVEAGEVFEALDRLVASGKVRHHGVSIHTVEEGAACLEVGSVASLQLVHNLFALLEPEESMEALFEPAVARQVGLIAREPLAHGFLSGLHDASTVYGEGDNRGRWPAARRAVFSSLAAAVRGLARDGVTLAQAALRFVLDEPAITTTIVGIKTPAQARENFGAVAVPHLALLEEASRATAEAT
jgi:aryl-alcohol dehydrogenase-like predicted oxidoreductase